MPIILLLFLILFPSMGWADANSNNAPLLIEEQNGTNAGRYRILQVTNGTSTNNNDGSIYVNTGAAGSQGQIQYNNGGVFAGGNIFQDTNGDIGIGTSVPTQLLTIASIGNPMTFSYVTQTLTVPGAVSSTGPGGFVQFPEVPTPSTPALGYDLIYFKGGSLPYFLNSFGQETLLDPFAPGISGGIYYSGGNVGIGVNSPGETLDVNGTVRATNFLSTGNVGIGSATPGTALDVNGTVRSTGLTAGASGITLGGVTNTAWPGGMGSNYWNLSPGNVGINTTGYNVGIGTFSPTSALSVVGGLSVQPSGNPTYPTIANGTIYTNGIGIGTWTPSYNLEIGSPIAGTTQQAAVVGDSNNSVDAQVLAVNTSSTIAMVSNGTSSTDSYGVPTLQSGIGTSSNTGIYFGVNGTNKMVLSNVGNLGIGSVNPIQELDVAGTVRMTNFNMPTGASNTDVLTSDGNGNGTWQPASGGMGSNYWTYSSSGNIGISTSLPVGIGTTFVGGAGEGKLVVMGGNVGIGTWTPGATLDVEGTLSTASFGGNVGIGTTFTSGSGLTVMKGNVGIGTWNPSYALQIGNNTSTGVEITSTSFSQVEAGSFDVAAGGGAGYDIGGSAVLSQSGSVETINGISSPSFSNLELFGNVGIGTSLNTKGFSVMNGNVGIGTWVPRGTLDVEGTLSTASFSGNVGIGTIPTNAGLQVTNGNIIGPNGGNINYAQIVCGNSTSAGMATATGTTPSITFPTNGTIVSATLTGTLSAGNCSATIDVWKTNAAIPTVSNTITASALPALSTAKYHQDTTLTGWTTAIATNDVIMCNVQSVTCDNWNLVLGVKE